MKLKWWPCLKEETGLRNPLMSLVKSLHNEWHIIVPLLALSYNQQPSKFASKEVLDSLCGRNASLFHSESPILPDISGTERIKTK